MQVLVIGGSALHRPGRRAAAADRRPRRHPLQPRPDARPVRHAGDPRRRGPLRPGDAGSARSRPPRVTMSSSTSSPSARRTPAHAVEQLWPAASATSSTSRRRRSTSSATGLFCPYREEDFAGRLAPTHRGNKLVVAVRLPQATLRVSPPARMGERASSPSPRCGCPWWWDRTTTPSAPRPTSNAWRTAGRSSFPTAASTPGGSSGSTDVAEAIAANLDERQHRSAAPTTSPSARSCRCAQFVETAARGARASRPALAAGAQRAGCSGSASARHSRRTPTTTTSSSTSPRRGATCCSSRRRSHLVPSSSSPHFTADLARLDLAPLRHARPSSCASSRSSPTSASPPPSPRHRHAPASSTPLADRRAPPH